jgi:hypothetical protein
MVTPTPSRLAHIVAIVAYLFGGSHVLELTFTKCFRSAAFKEVLHYYLLIGFTVPSPPSTFRYAPVTKACAGSRKKARAAAMSAGSPIRPSACIFREAANAASFPVIRAVMGVRVCVTEAHPLYWWGANNALCNPHMCNPQNSILGG